MNDKLRRSALLATATDPEGINNDFYNPNPNYLTIVALEDGLTVQLPKNSENEIEYSIDGNDNWTTLSRISHTPAINKDHYISFRGNIVPNSHKITGNFTISKSCNLTGNCNSLLFGDNAANNLDLTGYDYCHSYLFSCCPVVEVSPTFLPATTLAPGCYWWMFDGCTSLTIVPELPATTLVIGCYDSMFKGCSKLNYIKAMFMSPPSTSYTSSWVSGVSSTGTFVKNIDATWGVIGANGIPSGWTVELEEPSFDDYTSKPKYYLNMGENGIGENGIVGQNVYNFIMDKYINGGNEYKYDELIFINGYQISSIIKYGYTSIQLYCIEITYKALILHSNGVVSIEGGGSN